MAISNIICPREKRKNLLTLFKIIVKAFMQRAVITLYLVNMQIHTFIEDTYKKKTLKKCVNEEYCWHLG